MTSFADMSVGMTGRAEMTVSESDTAIAMLTSDVAVLATPRLIALCEQATMEAVQAALPEGWTTVAKRVRIDHLAPTSVGRVVVAEASLERIEGRRLVFTVTASDTAGLVAAGKVMRVAVDRARFLEKAH